MKREDLYESIDKQILAEKVYRSKIKKAITEFTVIKENKQKRKIIAEKIYRAKVRSDLKMFLEKKEVRVHNSTGMNALEDLFSNSNLISVLETDYSLLTTSFEQRNDYKLHILQKVIDMFRIEDLGEEEALSESLQRLFEEEDVDISIEVSDDELPEDKIVGPVRDDIEDEKQKKEDDENAESVDPDEDATGRNRAELAFNKIEKSIKTIYDVLSNPADKEEFKTYLIANLRMYFDKFENSLSNDPDPKFSADVEKAVTDAKQDLGSSETSETETSETETPETDEFGLDI